MFAYPDFDSEIFLGRFNRLMQEVQRGEVRRNSFLPWEIDLLLDLEAVMEGRTGRKELLLRYQRAVQREIGRGRQSPLKLSAYLADLEEKRIARKAETMEPATVSC